MKSYFSRLGVLVAVVGMVVVSAGPANAELIHHWKFDDTGTDNYTAVDSAGSIDGTLADTSVTRGYQTTGGALWTSGKIGGALEFKRANNNNVGLGENMLGGSYTVAAWIKGASFASDDENVIFDQYIPLPGRFLFEVRNGQLCVFSGGNGSDVPSVVALGSDLSTDTWYHVAVTNNNKAVTVYLNGNVDTTATFDFDAPGTGSNDIGGGAGVPYTWGGFDGLIDDVRLYNTALSQGEIQSLVPEPSAFLLLATGLLALLAYAWRKRR